MKSLLCKITDRGLIPRSVSTYRSFEFIRGQHGGSSGGFGSFSDGPGISSCGSSMIGGGKAGVGRSGTSMPKTSFIISTLRCNHHVGDILPVASGKLDTSGEDMGADIFRIKPQPKYGQLGNLPQTEICLHVLLHRPVNGGNVLELAPRLDLAKSLNEDFLLAGSTAKIPTHTAVADIVEEFPAVQELVALVNQQPSRSILGSDGIFYVKVNPPTWSTISPRLPCPRPRSNGWGYRPEIFNGTDGCFHAGLMFILARRCRFMIAAM